MNKRRATITMVMMIDLTFVWIPPGLFIPYSVLEVIMIDVAPLEPSIKYITNNIAKLL